MRSISSRSRRADRAGPSACGQQRYTKAVSYTHLDVYKRQQYNQLIARRVRECNVYCEVKPNTMTVDEIRAFDPIGIIFTGGPQSV